MPLCKSLRLQFTATKKLLSTDHVNDFFGIHCGSGEFLGGFALSPREFLGHIVPIRTFSSLEIRSNPWGGGSVSVMMLHFI